MKRRFVASIILALSIVFMSQVFVAADEAWKIGGVWDYKLSGEGTYYGAPATMTESGNLRIIVVTSGEKEILDSYSLTCQGNTSVPSSSYSHNYNYSHNGTFNPLEYVPGAPLQVLYEQIIDQTKVIITLQILQTGPYSAVGTATLYIPETEEINQGTITASKPQPSSGDGGGGGCNAGLGALLLLTLVPILLKSEH